MLTAPAAATPTQCPGLNTDDHALLDRLTSFNTLPVNPALDVAPPGGQTRNSQYNAQTQRSCTSLMVHVLDDVRVAPQLANKPVGMHTSCRTCSPCQSLQRLACQGPCALTGAICVPPGPATTSAAIASSLLAGARGPDPDASRIRHLRGCHTTLCYPAVCIPPCNHLLLHRPSTPPFRSAGLATQHVGRLFCTPPV